jgi:DNA mismatch repair protein MutS
MRFQSILFKNPDARIDDTLEAPDFFIDLNLDQIINAITAGKQEYYLKPFFYSPMKDTDAIEYRQEVMRDLENEILFEKINSFAQKMGLMGSHLAQAEKLHYKYQQEKWFLDAVDIYCGAINSLSQDLSHVDLKSRGFLAFREYLAGYADSDDFRTLVAETKKLISDLFAIKYSLLIRGSSITEPLIRI